MSICFVSRVPPETKPLLIGFAVVAAIALALTWRSPMFSTIAVGVVPLVPIVWGALTLMPMLNDIASTQRLIAATEKQRVPPESVAI